MTGRMNKWIVLIMMSALLVACSAVDNDISEQGTVTVPESLESNESKAIVSEEKRPFEGEVIRVLSHDNVYARSLKNLAGDFKDKTGATLELVPVGQAFMEEQIQLDFANGTGSVDVAYMPLIFTGKWASAGWIQPIDDYVAVDQTEIDMNDFVASAVDALRYEGNLYGLPGFAGTALMAYRTDILADHGYDEAPKTWEELLEVCEAIHNEDTAAIALRSQQGQGINMYIYPMFMWAYGGSFFERYPRDLTPVIDSSENLQALNMYTELIRPYSPEDGDSYSYPEVIEAMQTGKAAIIIDGTSVLGPACDPANNPYSDKIKMALVPEGPAGSSPSFAVHGWAIPTFAKNQTLAWEFIKWATSSEVQKEIALGAGGELYYDYTRESVGNDPEVIEKQSYYNIVALRNEALKSTRPDFRPLIAEWSEIGELMGAYVHETVTGEISANEALDKAQTDVLEIIEGAYEIE